MAPRRAGKEAGSPVGSRFRRVRRQPAARGASLLETVVVAGLFIAVAGLSMPLLTTARHQQHVASAARYLTGRIMLARADAARSGATVGLRFVTRNGQVFFRSFRDGDGDGVRTADIGAGVDLPVGEETAIGDLFKGVRFALGAAVPQVGSSGPAGADADPVRFGSSDILSVTPLGTASSGTLYLRSREGHQVAIRVLGGTARVQHHVFDYTAGRWRIR